MMIMEKFFINNILKYIKDLTVHLKYTNIFLEK